VKRSARKQCWHKILQVQTMKGRIASQGHLLGGHLPHNNTSPIGGWVNRRGTTAAEEVTRLPTFRQRSGGKVRSNSRHPAAVRLQRPRLCRQTRSKNSGGGSVPLLARKSAKLSDRYISADNPAPTCVHTAWIHWGSLRYGHRRTVANVDALRNMCNDCAQHVRWAEHRKLMQALDLTIPRRNFPRSRH
jgi:hypothetical protein